MVVENQDTSWEQVEKAYQVALDDPALQGIGTNGVPDAQSDFVESQVDVDAALKHCVKFSMMCG
jgi:hypothetical protein